VALRYFSVYGPRQRPDMAFDIFARAAIAGEPITVFGDGEQSRDFTFVDDVVAATRAATYAPDDVVGGIYNIGGGSQASLNTVLSLLSDLSGRDLEVRHLNRERGDVRHTSADISRARADLGFDPRTTLSEGLQAQFEWIQADTLAGRHSR
jgi:UDP-glucose 4-epimerase